MDQVILDRINETVGVDDTLYILGDFTFRGKDPIEYRERIICKDIHVLIGNHDREKDFFKHLISSENSYGFSSVQSVKEVIYWLYDRYISDTLKEPLIVHGVNITEVIQGLTGRLF